MNNMMLGACEASLCTLATNNEIMNWDGVLNRDRKMRFWVNRCPQEINKYW